MSLNYAAGQLSMATLLVLCLFLPKSSLKDKIVSDWNLFAALLSEEGNPWAFTVVAVHFKNIFYMKIVCNY